MVSAVPHAHPERDHGLGTGRDSGDGLRVLHAVHLCGHGVLTRNQQGKTERCHSGPVTASLPPRPPLAVTTTPGRAVPAASVTEPSMMPVSGPSASSGAATTARARTTKKYCFIDASSGKGLTESLTRPADLPQTTNAPRRLQPTRSKEPVGRPKQTELRYVSQNVPATAQ